MLPPLLSLLLDCAKQTDQSVVSISLGALVHLIEVGGHQFSESDWDMLLKSIRCISLISLKSFVTLLLLIIVFILIIRDASYTTQPLELLNALGFDSASLKSFDNEEVDGHTFDVRDNGNVHLLPSPNTGPDGTAGNPNAAVPLDHYQESGSQSNVNGSEG